ncbi:MAG: FAD-dependent oxidoreductase [Hyphomonadaceae bacterium]
MTRFTRPQRFTSWGRIERLDYPMAHPRFSADLPALLQAPDRPRSMLAVGMGRSYGDSCLNSDGGLISMRGLDRFNQIDKAGRTLRAQAGMTLDEALRLLVPRGLTLPVVPGTRFVTLGGAVANDVHGKNHASAGTFGRWVRAIGLARQGAPPQALTPGDAQGLFNATVGGLGLTGLISWVEINVTPIESSDLEVEDIAFSTLEEYFDLMNASTDAPYRVAWVDCTAPGKGIFSRARPMPDGGLVADAGGGGARIPFDGPGFLINGLTLSAFNMAFGAMKHARRGPRRVHYQHFHFPLDSIKDWNRLYGGRGFRQYQCALPSANAKDAIREILKIVKKAGDGSMLAVLKEFGGLASPGLLSFPMAGSTLALDFRNRGEKSLKLLDTLDSIVLRAGGRIYPAKDGRVPAHVFQQMFPNWRELELRRDPSIRSNFWTRVSAQ